MKINKSENDHINECAERHLANIDRIFDEAKLKFEAFKIKISEDIDSF